MGAWGMRRLCAMRGAGYARLTAHGRDGTASPTSKNAPCSREISIVWLLDKESALTSRFFFELRLISSHKYPI